MTIDFTKASEWVERQYQGQNAVNAGKVRSALAAPAPFDDDLLAALCGDPMAVETPDQMKAEPLETFVPMRNPCPRCGGSGGQYIYGNGDDRPATWRYCSACGGEGIE